MVNNCAIDCQTTVSRVKFGSGVEKSDNGNPQMNPSIIFKSDQSRLPAFLKNQFANRVAILGPHDFLESKGLSYQWVGQRRYYANDPLKKEKNRKVYENEYKDKIKAENKWNREPEDWRRYSSNRDKEIIFTGKVTISALATLLGTKKETVARMMRQSGFEVDFDAIPIDVAELVALEFGLKPKIQINQVKDLQRRPPILSTDNYPLRPPVVTIMGHVDHGKTTLLDYLRSTSVAKGEAGGITQHIGAFSMHIKTPNGEQKITFLDTPGHEAFQQMRKRGAQVTDIVVLVVACDDGVMPQTIEAIKHAKNSNAAIIVAINKCDKPHGDLGDLKMQLLNNEVQLEEMGGEIQAVEISGLTGLNVEKLVESILTQADLMNLKGDYNGPVEAVIIESKIDKQRGKLATIIVQRGTLKVGQILVSRNTFCKVRQINDEKNQILQEGTPSSAVEISGWKDLPVAGDIVIQAENEEVAKEVVDMRLNKERDLEEMKANQLVQLRRLDNLEENQKEKDFVRRQRRGQIDKGERYQRNDYSSRDQDEGKSVNVIVKGDVMGSVEALEMSLNKMYNDEIGVKIVQSGVGFVTETDVEFAATSNAAIVAFNLKTPKEIKDLAKRKKVEILEERIIYKVMDVMKDRLSKALPAIQERVVIAEARVLQPFNITVKGKTNTVGGSKVLKGSIQANSKVQIKRGDQIVFEGSIQQLRVHKDEVGKVEEGTECGMLFDNFNDILKGDVIQAYELKEKQREFIPASA